MGDATHALPLPSVAREYKWQYKTGRGWAPFSLAEDRILEAAYKSGEPEVHYAGGAGRGLFFADLSKMEIYSEATRERCKLRFSSHDRSAATQTFDARARDESAVSRDIYENHLEFACDASGELVPVVRPVHLVSMGGRLDVLAVRARGLPSPGASPYLEITVGSDAWKRVVRTGSCREGGCTPVWNQAMSLHIRSFDTQIHFRVMSETRLGGDRVLASGDLPLAYILPFASQTAMTALRDPSLLPPTRTPPAGLMSYLAHSGDTRGGGIRTWFGLSAGAGSGGGAGGALLLHVRFNPTRGSRVVLRPQAREFGPGWDMDSSFSSRLSSGRQSGKRNDLKMTHSGATPAGLQGTDTTTLMFDNPPPHTRVFGMSLAHGVAASDTRFPAPVSDCVSYIRACGLREEGVFRLSGSKSTVDRVCAHYDKGHAAPIPDVHTAAGVLKAYFRGLHPEPLIPRTFHSRFAGVASRFSRVQALASSAETLLSARDERVQAYAKLLFVLPALNRQVLIHLFALLADISACEGDNKMTAENLAVVWAPNLLRESGRGASRHAATQLVKDKIRCVADLIREFSLIKARCESEDHVATSTFASPGSARPEAKLTTASTAAAHDACGRIGFRVAASGLLDKTGKGGSKYKQRFFRLLIREGRDPCVTYAEHKARGGSLLGVINLLVGQCAVSAASHEEDREQRLFRIVVPGRQYNLRAPTPHDRSVWVFRLKKALQKAKNRRFETEKRLSSTAAAAPPVPDKAPTSAEHTQRTPEPLRTAARAAPVQPLSHEQKRRGRRHVRRTKAQGQSPARHHVTVSLVQKLTIKNTQSRDGDDVGHNKHHGSVEIPPPPPDQSSGTQDLSPVSRDSSPPLPPPADP